MAESRSMQDKDLYSKLLGLSPPWLVIDVELKLGDRQVSVSVFHDPDVPLRCPVCGNEAPRYDSRTRRWRHLDTMQYQTFLVCEVPRTKCDVDGVHQVDVPWAEPGSRFTALFEILAIDWLRETSIQAVAGMLGLSWDEAAGIQKRAVERGLARREIEPAEVIGIDEVAFQRRHEYVSTIIDVRKGKVLHVLDGRGKAPLVEFFLRMPDPWRKRVKVVAMDMWEAFISAVSEALPGAEIAFDRFHVAKHLNEAVNNVRKDEHRKLRKDGDSVLTRTRFLWLTNPENLSDAQFDLLQSLRGLSLKVSRAWAIKETNRHLWNYKSRGWADRAWKHWLAWAQRSRLPAMIKVGRMIRTHYEGVLTAVVTGVTNAATESINSRIQWIKRLACGFRNRERFKQAIYFHLGGLDLYPEVTS